MAVPSDRRVLAAFASVVVLGGSNLVLVVFTARELDPFWAAALRFTGAAAVAWVATLLLRLPIPRGRALATSAIYGTFAFFGGFALFYWGTQRVPASVASVVMGAVPLLTLLLAVAQGSERFRVRGAIGAVLSIAGIAVISARSPAGGLPIVPLLAVVGAAASAAQSGIVVRGTRDAHPLAVNAVGMTVGAVGLLWASMLAGEPRVLPATSPVIIALLVMIVTSPMLFVLYVFVVQRWSASAAAYQFVLFPLVSIQLAAVVLDEPISTSLIIGAPLVLLGVYVGALAPDRSVASVHSPGGSPRWKG